MGQLPEGEHVTLALTITTTIVLVGFILDRLVYVTASDERWKRASLRAAANRDGWKKLSALLWVAAAIAGIALLWGWMR
jgi:hypothetical protein